MSRLLFTCTHHEDDPERATLPFIAATVAAAAGQDAIVVCTVDAVRIGTPAGAEAINAPGFPPLKQLYDELIAAGGQVWLCSSCTTPRGIDESMLTDGARIVGAAVFIEEIVNGAKQITVA